MTAIHLTPSDLSYYPAAGVDHGQLRGGTRHAPHMGIGDRVSLHRLSASDAMALLHGRLAANLGGAAPARHAPDPRTPAGVAAGALHALNGHLNRGAPGDGIATAQAAIDTAFNETRDMLSAAGVTDKGINAALDKAYSLLQRGLERLGGNGQVGAVEQYSHTESLERSRSASIQIQTREGDVVTIELAQSQSHQQATYYATDDNGRLFGQTSQQSSAARLHFHIQGDLSEEEQQAIQDLMKGLEKVGDQLVNGDMKGVMAQASGLKMDGGVLSGFTARMNYAERYRSVESYSAVTPATAEPAALGAPLKAALDNLNADQVLHEPQKDLPQLLAYVMDQKHGDAQGVDTLAHIKNLLAGLQDQNGTALSHSPKTA